MNHWEKVFWSDRIAYRLDANRRRRHGETAVDVYCIIRYLQIEYDYILNNLKPDT